MNSPCAFEKAERALVILDGVEDDCDVAVDGRHLRVVVSVHKQQDVTGSALHHRYNIIIISITSL